MSESTKIDFRHRRIQQVADISDIVSILFPGSRKQRYAAACILFELKWADHMVPNLAMPGDQVRHLPPDLTEGREQSWRGWE